MGDIGILSEVIKKVYEKNITNKTGNVAQYIPELAKVDPEPFGIAVATVNKDIITVGDVEKKFTIQSISKAFIFGLALELFGAEKVFQHVGAEPSGEAFNAIELDPVKNVAYNPMVNAGALAMSSLIYDKYANSSEQVILEFFESLSGGKLSINHQVYESELNTAHRNRALAHLMNGAGIINGKVDEKVALYTKQCSIEINAKELAIMASTLANFGTNPYTGKTVFGPLTARYILSVMFTCGMYDYAGRWAVDVGLPAKSGVSGGLMAVVNRQIGIGLYSPRLDNSGNSIRATKACIDLAEELGLHAFEFTNKGSSMLDFYI